MRKSLIVLLLVGLVMSVANLAWADLLTQGEEAQVWRWDGNSWVSEPLGGLEANARAWHQGDTLNGFCNKQTWTIDVATHASIAQWIKWELGAQGWNIKVRKPGIYVAGPIKGWVKSNADVLATAQGFDDLKNDLGEAIETFYGFSESSDVMPTEWVKATQLPSSVTIPFCYHEGYLWIKFVIREDPQGGYPKTRACEYQNDAKIFLSLTVIKGWIDPETGYFEQ